MFYLKSVPALFFVFALLTPTVAYADEFEIEQDEFLYTALTPSPFIIQSNYYPTTPREAWPDKINMYWPTGTKQVYSGFGYRTPSCNECSSHHKGIDFAHEVGHDVYVAMDGIISRIENGAGYGNHIYVEHIVEKDGEIQYWTTRYAHLRQGSVAEGLSVGSAVIGGQKIAEVGNTGTSTGPHLHFELLVEKEVVNPEIFLKTYTN